MLSVKPATTALEKSLLKSQVAKLSAGGVRRPGRAIGHKDPLADDWVRERPRAYAQRVVGIGHRALHHRQAHHFWRHRGRDWAGFAPPAMDLWAGMLYSNKARVGQAKGWYKISASERGSCDDKRQVRTFTTAHWRLSLN
jgi:hypothetical protein